MPWTAKAPLSRGIRGRCPQCGKGKLFRGFLKLASRCDVCGLEYGFADPADGPAFFAMTAMSFPVVGFAVWFDAAYGALVGSSRHDPAAPDCFMCTTFEASQGMARVLAIFL